MSQSIKNMYPENIQYIVDLLSNVFTHANIKVTGSAIMALASFFFGASLYNMALVVLFSLIIFDTITAIMAAYHNGVEIQSHKILRTVIKMCVYFLMVSAGHLCEVATGHILPIETTIIAFLAITEFVSILENIGKLGYVVPQTLLNKLKDLRDQK